MNQLKEEENNYITLPPVQNFELVYRDVSVIADIQIPDIDTNPICCIYQPKKIIQKTILKQCSGAFQPFSLTAIMGPSGCGKTTMLNLLSGRLIPSSNLFLYGSLSVNGEETESLTNFKNHVGYVMQQDCILATFSPKQSFEFIANLKLPQKTNQQRDIIVNQIISSLGLSKCQNTLIGNNIIRGISGGERKRASIGLQLLVNPSILFLDEPSTGLDSTTAFNLIKLLKDIAKSGRTIVSTIHQPSSEIFLEFDKLLLMVDGNIIYHGQTLKSMNYFKELGKPVPLHSNPLDYYMKMMNKEGIQLDHLAKGTPYTEQQVNEQFKEILDNLIKSYKQTPQNLKHTVINPIQDNTTFKAFILYEFLYLVKRSFLNEFRNPASIFAKIFQSVVFALTCFIIFQRKGHNFQSFDQNLKGLSFFLVMSICYAAIFSSLNSFASQRSVFVREKLSNTYSLGSYFISRIIASLPMLILIPTVSLGLPYWFVNLEKDVGSYFLTLLTLILLNWMSSSYGFLLSAIFPNPVLVTALIPTLMVPLQLTGGFFTPLSQVHDFFRIFQYLSPFKYSFQAFIQIQYKNGVQWTGYDQANPNVLQSEQYNFDESLQLNLLLLFSIGVLFYIISFVGLWYLSSPHDIRLQKPKQKPCSESLQDSIIKIKDSTNQIKIKETN